MMITIKKEEILGVCFIHFCVSREKKKLIGVDGFVQFVFYVVLVCSYV